MSSSSPAENLVTVVDPASVSTGTGLRARRRVTVESTTGEDAAPGEDRWEDPTDGIGRRVAAYRAERGLRVSDLAREVGVSPSLVSQIERGQSRPSVSTLFAIAQALGVAVDAFFRETDHGSGPAPAAGTTGTTDATGATGATAAAGDDGDAASTAATTLPAGHEDRYVVRRANRSVIDIESGVRWERLTPAALHNVEFLELIYGPGAESSTTLYRHPGEEMILVLSGELDIYLGFECYRLVAGDSMHFSSMQPHRYVNPTTETARAVTTILHDGAWYSTPGVHGEP